MGHKPAARKTTKSIGRKAPKRKPMAPVVDLDLVELAEVIAENKLDANVDGWFKLPWRDGWNAVGLCSDLAGSVGVPSLGHSGIGLWLASLYRLRGNTTNTTKLYQDIEDEMFTTQTNPERAGLRCVQVLVANSDGGGTVYNSILSAALRNVDTELLAHVVLKWRCMDAIGVTPTFTNDGNDRLRRAFKTAWERGLYQAAYSLPQAKKAS